LRQSKCRRGLEHFHAVRKAPELKFSAESRKAFDIFIRDLDRFPSDR
jgi:hypothetical protein